jgi:hypothetical protein
MLIRSAKPVPRHLQSRIFVYEISWREADLRNSYLPDAEGPAGDKGIIDFKSGRFYLFRDPFIIGGPSESPVGVNDSMDATKTFAKIYQAGELNNAKTVVPTRFDKSATNSKESSLWLGT